MKLILPFLLLLCGPAAAAYVGPPAGDPLGAAAAEAARATASEGAAAQKSNNLSDLASAATARTNLGLGTAALANTTAFDAFGLSAAETTRATTAESLRAPIANPTFTGTVTIPAGASVAGFAPLASPTFTGTPTVPTPAGGSNNGQIVNTAFLNAAASGLLPSATTSQLYGGTGAPGSAQAISLGANLTLSGTTLSATGGGSTPLSTTPTASTGTALDASSGTVIPVSAAAPTTGTYAVGAIVRNSAVTEQGSTGAKYVNPFFICIVAGTPGTWVPLNIADGR